MDKGLNELYQAIGALTSEVSGLRRDIQQDRLTLAETTRRADESRAVVHRRLDDAVSPLTHVESDVFSMKIKVDEVSGVTDEIKNLRQQALGAGTLGVWIWKIAGWVIAAAAGVMAAYTWLTGRLPP